jgi:hypothetical protein
MKKELKLMDLDSLSLPQIEQYLKIRKFNREYFQNERGVSDTILDSWGEVEQFIRFYKKRDTMYRSFSVLGYELVNDNHYIKVYYYTEIYTT